MANYKKIYSYFSQVLFYIFVIFFVYYIVKNRNVFYSFKEIRYPYLTFNFFISIPAVLFLSGWLNYLIKIIYNVKITFFQAFYIGAEALAYNYILPFGTSIVYRGGLLKFFHTLKFRDFFVYNVFYLLIIYFLISFITIFVASAELYYFFLLLAIFSLLTAIIIWFIRKKLNFNLSLKTFSHLLSISIIYIIVFFFRYYILIFAVTGNTSFISSLLLSAVVIISLPLKITPAGFGVRELLMYYTAHAGNINNIEIIIILDRLLEIIVYFLVFGFLKLKNQTYLKNNLKVA